MLGFVYLYKGTDQVSNEDWSSTLTELFLDLSIGCATVDDRPSLFGVV
jgi:hypothetical protein